MNKHKGVAEYAMADEARMCPVCGEEQLEMFEICGCGWQNDPVQFADPDFAGGANRMSLNEAKKAYAEGRPVE